MINFRKLNKDEKQSRYSNMRARCGKEYQDRNPRYYGTFMCDIWEDNKELYYEWLDENFYEVNGEQMDVDKDILQYGNKQYHPDLCLIVNTDELVHTARSSSACFPVFQCTLSAA